jgi:hypothetical protein
VGFRPIYFGADLNFDAVFFGSFPELTILGISDEYWQDAFRAIDGVYALDELCTDRGPLLRRRSTLADANERRDWRIWADFAAILGRSE